jgi:hypothetical protein
MGYRSDVSYALEFRELSCKRKFVSVAKLDPVYGMALKECEHVDDDELYIWAKFDWVKWYDEYEDVSCHMSMLSHIADDKLDGVSAKFVRIGEEIEDTEEMVFEGEDCPHAWDIKIGASRYIINDYKKEGE